MTVLGIVFLVIIALVVLGLVVALGVSAKDIKRYFTMRKM